MNQPIFIGISGASASGKSLLAKTILEELGSDKVCVISEDSYYKDRSDIPVEERLRINYDHPDAFDYTLMLDQLQKLQQGVGVQIPNYDHKRHQRDEATTYVAGDHSIIIMEGILLFVEPKIRDFFQIRIFIDTPLDICLARRLERDLIERNRTAKSVLEQYLSTVRPMYLQFIEPSKKYADLIVPHGGENRIAIDVIKAKIKEFLNHSS